MLIPSGMLWKAIASVRAIPNFILLVVAIKVAIPSGILCKIMASMLIMPILYNLLFLELFSGSNASIVIEQIIPITKKIKQKRIFGTILNILLNSLKASGNKSVNDTVIITPAAKAREFMTILSLFLNLINIGSVPINVDNPAIIGSIKGYILFIESPFKYMKITIIF